MENKILVKNIEDLPNAKEITNIEAGLYVAADGPAVVVTAKKKQYVFPLTTGFAVHLCNEMLKSLNLGIEIGFLNFVQYFDLVETINELLGNRLVTVKG